MKKYSILIVEDDKAIRSLIQTALEAEQFGAITAYNGASAIVQARAQAPSIILLDLGLPDTDGIQIIDENGNAGHIIADNQIGSVSMRT